MFQLRRRQALASTDELPVALGADRFVSTREPIGRGHVPQGRMRQRGIFVFYETLGGSCHDDEGALKALLPTLLHVAQPNTIATLALTERRNEAMAVRYDRHWPRYL